MSDLCGNPVYTFVFIISFKMTPNASKSDDPIMPYSHLIHFLSSFSISIVGHGYILIPFYLGKKSC